jgi:transposase
VITVGCDGLRFASDVTDAEWRLIEPLLPPHSPVGLPPEWPMREIVNAIFYVLRGGIPWRMLPRCFPPHQTVYGWFAAWRDAGVWQAIVHHLVMRDRRRVGREASPSAAMIDSQSVKTTEAGGRAAMQAPRHGRHGRPLVLQVHPASVQDCDGALPLLKASRRKFPFVESAFVDTAYAAQRVAEATCIAIEVVRKPIDQIGFAVHPRRWAVERCFACSDETAASPRISRQPSLPPPPSSMPPQPCC